MNPRSTRQKVAAGKISGLPGVQKFHFKDIPATWFKVDIKEIFHSGVALMMPLDDDEQTHIEHVKGTCTIWDQKYLKLV